jgi:FHA domain
MPDVSYVPGTLIAVAGEHCLALIAATPDAEAATWIWQRVSAGMPAETLLAGLLGAGFAGVGGFALLASHTTGQPRLFCRGAISATVEGGTAPARIDGAGLLTWREHPVAADAERIVLGERPVDNAFRLPAAAGVLLAGCVVVDLTGAAARDTSPYDLPLEGYSPVRPDTIENTVRAEVPDTITIVGRASAPDAVAAGADVSRHAREATLPADDDIRGGATRPPSPTPSPRPGPHALIDVVQWGLESGAPARSADQAPAVPSGIPGLADEPDAALTVSRADLAEQAVRSAPPDRIGPSVSALICPAGHVNPPSEAACRQCGEPLPNDTVIVPRPVLGVLRLSTGDVITLDRDVVMGRNPRSDFTGDDGEERPHVVKLPSADGDISRTHLRVSLDGWHVLVTDLNSTNGTLVTLPGRDPEQLRRGETVPIRPGTVVTLADGIDFRYEVPG